MKRIIPLGLAASVLLAGCVAEMVETRGDKMALFRSPTEKPGQGGIIRYNNRGAPSWRVKRRQDAKKQMNQFCQGAYTVTAEGPRSQFTLRNGIGFDPIDPNQYIAFDCAKPPEPTLLERFKR